MSPVIVGLLIRALILLALAWLAVTLLRRRSASLRALVWTAALGGILVLPVMASVAPTLDVPVWPAEVAATQAIAEPATRPSTTVTDFHRYEVPLSRVAAEV
ncbi:MAG TPA: hypothetical protein VFD64_15520, partial [Gemmatimonadaceae bacterium]|nr:hypothetical protein [Gemmatimonadaceae bacterium]